MTTADLLSVDAHVHRVAQRSRVAAKRLALLSRADKDAALLALADAVADASDAVIAVNDRDLRRGAQNGMSASLQDRLRLTPDRVLVIAEALRSLAGLADPVGEVVRGSTLANGLSIRQLRVPMGVIGMIYEARPNVTVDAAGLGLKSGNAMILRGGSAAAHSNAVLVQAMRAVLVERDLPVDAVQLLSGDRDEVRALITARGLVDLVIPRGGADLIQTVVLGATVPVIETGIGNCHIYLDAAADPAMACAIALNAKVQRPSVCNAAESILVHRQVADRVLPELLQDLQRAGVLLHLDPGVAAYAEQAGTTYEQVTEQAWAAEFHGLQVSVGIVDSLDAAIAHIDRYGTGHTEVIVTENRAHARRFVVEVDAAVVMVNASSRFTDGAEFGFGAEIGISTQKLHARGPMALQEMTSTKWVVEGDGQVRR